ncbi:MAG: UpxY family transcription antiterminator [Terriglobales bacterium]
MLENTLSNYTASGNIVQSASITQRPLLAPVEDYCPVERWYALSVRMRHEKMVARHLQYEGINHSLPLYRSVRRWKDRRKELDMPLFPGYLFVNLKLGDRASVLRAPGVRQFVIFQGQPAVVPDVEIRALESTFAAGLQPQPHPYLCQGRRVRVKRGALLGTEGILIRRKEGFRLVLSIEMIMRSVMLEVDEADVEPQ